MWGVSVNGKKQNSCRARLLGHFGYIVPAASETGSSVNSRINLNVVCGQKFIDISWSKKVPSENSSLFLVVFFFLRGGGGGGVVGGVSI